MNRPMSLPLAIIASLWLALPASRAEAEPITFTYSGWAHGSMNGTPLTPAPVYFQLMATADTSAVKSCETSRPCFYVRIDTASITITGWGTFDFITPTQMVSYVDGADYVGLQRAGATGLGEWGHDLIRHGWPVWDMQSSTPLISGPASMLTWALDFGILTEAGSLVFPDTYSASVWFSASVATVPEPAARREGR